MQPGQPTTTPQPAVSPEPLKKRSVKLPIILMSWPAASIILVIALYAIVNLIANSTAPAPTDGELFAKPDLLQSTIQVILFIVGALSVAFGPISFVVGLVLLIIGSKKK